MKLQDISVVILCAGEATRWNNHLGVPKQLAPVNGEPILERTIRLLNERNIYSISVVSRNTDLHLPNTHFFEPEKYDTVLDSVKSTTSLWAKKTIVLLGDVFFTEDSIDTIINDSNDGLRVFGRSGRSNFTHTTYSEIFSLSFHEEDWNTVTYNLDRALADCANGGRGKLWEFYRITVNIPTIHLNIVDSSVFCEVHDFTDDFDTPEDYDLNINRYTRFTSPKYLDRLVLTVYLKYRKVYQKLHHAAVKVFNNVGKKIKVNPGIKKEA